MRHLAAAAGYARSLLIYRGIPGRAARLRRFYAPFIGPGALCFDIGAHLGNHAAAWTALGARVVAVEPQPAFAARLRRRFADAGRVEIVEAAAGPAPGRATLRFGAGSPTLASLSAAWIGRIAAEPGFRRARWDEEVEVTVVTLDALTERFGVPVHCKIDVEGFEDEVLSGLSRPLPSLSFEYLPATADLAHRALDRLAALGRWRFNVTEGETARYALSDWCDMGVIRQFLDRLEPADRSGDIHARLEGWE